MELSIRALQYINANINANSYGVFIPFKWLEYRIRECVRLRENHAHQYRDVYPEHYNIKYYDNSNIGD